MSWNLGKDKIAIVKVDSIDVYRDALEPTVVTGTLHDKMLFGDINDFRNYFNSPQLEMDSNNRLQCSYDKYFVQPRLGTVCHAAITDVIFNDPATIVFWSDGDKTIVKATDEKFDKEKGLAMAIAKKLYGCNKGNYYNVFKQYCGEETAEPERKKGKWIDTGSGQECPECHEIQYGYDNFRYFCAFCGADMRGE